MAKHRVPLAALTAMALLAGCPAPNTGKPEAPGGTGTGTKASPRPSTGVASAALQPASGVTIAGLATAPAGIVAAGAGNVLVNNGGSMVAAGAGNVISPNGAQLVLLAVDQAPLAGAEVFLAGPDGQPLPDIPAVKTDAAGRYRLTGAPATGTFTVQVRVKNKAGVATTLTTLVRPTAAGATANVSLGTHCVATAVLDGQGGNLGEFNPAKFQSAVETTDKELTPETWPDPADRAAILATMSRLEAKIDLLQATMNEIRAELKRLNDQLAASPSPAPAASQAPASAAPSASASAAATSATDLALRAKVDGAGEDDMRVVFVAGDSDGGEIVGDDDGDVGEGVQIHLEQATFPATYRVYAQKDEDDLDPVAVRSDAANLLGVLVVTGVGPGKSTFTPRTGAVVSISGARLVPYFEPMGAVQAYNGVFKWEPDDEAVAAPPGPFTFEVTDEQGDNWSAKNPYTLEVQKQLGDTVTFTPMVNEFPARFLVAVSYTDADGVPQREEVGYLRVHRHYVTDEILVRFDRDGDAQFDLDRP